MCVHENAANLTDQHAHAPRQWLPSAVDARAHSAIECDLRAVRVRAPSAGFALC